MEANTPNIVNHLEKIIQEGGDYQMFFSHFYFSLMLLNCPPNWAGQLLDLFLLCGENIIHGLIILMLKYKEQQII